MRKHFLLVYTYGITDYDSRGDDDNGGNDNQHGCGDDDHDRCRNDDCTWTDNAEDQFMHCRCP